MIDAILEDDKQRPAKQRHRAKRIFERLKAEHGFTGGYTIVKDYVRSAQLRSREMFIPLTHAPESIIGIPGKDTFRTSGRQEISGSSRDVRYAHQLDKSQANMLMSNNLNPVSPS